MTALEGQVAVVTGASGGIGACLAALVAGGGVGVEAGLGVCGRSVLDCANGGRKRRRRDFGNRGERLRLPASGESRVLKRLA